MAQIESLDKTLSNPKDVLLDYFSEIINDYPELSITNYGIKNNYQRKCVYIFPKNISRRGNVIFEIWSRKEQGEFHFYSKKEFLTNEEIKIAESHPKLKHTSKRKVIPMTFKYREDFVVYFKAKLDFLANNLDKYINGTTIDYFADESAGTDAVVKTSPVVSYDEVKTIPYDVFEDAEYVKSTNEASVEKISLDNEYVPTPEILTDTEKSVVSKSYPRDPSVAKAALMRANFKCEYNIDHWTFTRRTDNLPYTEPHHLIPMSQQKLFRDKKLDVQANIVSLCSNCHNFIHYGVDYERKDIIMSLYLARQEELKQAGIWIDLKTLFKMYGLS